MDSHSLVEVAYMLHRVGSTIVYGERWLSESPRKFCSFNSACERRPGNLIQRPAHSIVSQASLRWALVPIFVMVIIVIRERFTRWSSWPVPIVSVPFITRRNVRVGGSLSSLLVAQLPLQLIDLQLHGFRILFMRDVTPTSRMTSTNMGGVCTSLPVLPTFKIKEVILTLGPCGFLSVRTWTYYNWLLHSLSHKNFPQTTPIVRTQFGS